MGCRRDRRRPGRVRGRRRKKLRSALRYQLANAPTNDWLRKLAEEEADAAQLLTARPLPDAPEIPGWAGTVWQAFDDLASQRTMLAVPIPAPGGGFLFDHIPNALPWTAIDAWASRYGVEAGEFEFFARMVKAMDAEYLAFAAEKRRR